MASLLLELLGKDTSASSALETLEGKGKMVAGAISAAFAGMALGDAFNANIENSGVLAEFTAGLGQTPEIAKQAGDLAGQLYRQGLGGSLEDVTTAIGAVGSQMVDLGKTSPTQLEKLTRAAMSVSKVMGTDVVEVTRAAGQMMKNGMAPDAMTAFDILAQGAQNGANRAGDLLDVLSEYGGNFAQMGIDGPMALGLINGALDKGAYTGDIAVDALREFSINVLENAKGISWAYDKVGVDQDKTMKAIAAGGPAAKEAFTAVMKGLNDIEDPLDKQNAGMLLFGSMWGDAQQKMILGMDPALISIDKVAGAATEMGDTLQDTAETKVEAMRRGFQGWLQDITEVDGPIGDITTTLAAMGPIGLSAVTAVSSGVMALKDLGVASKLAAAGQWLLNTALFASPITWIIAGIAALVAGFVLLWQNCEGFRNFWITIWEAIKLAAQMFVDWFVEHFQWAIDLVKGYFNIWWTVVSGVFNFVKDAASQLIDFFTGGWRKTLDQVRVLWQTWVDWVNQKLMDIYNWFKDKIDAIGRFWSGLWQGAQRGLLELTGAIDRKLRELQQWFLDKIRTIQDAFWQLWQNIQNWFNDKIEGIKRIWNDFKTWVGGIIQPVVDRFITGWNNIASAAEGMARRVRQAFSSLTQGGSDGNPFNLNFTSGFQGLVNAPRAAAGAHVIASPGGSLVNVGEGGEDEFVVPLSKMPGMGGGTTVNVYPGVMVADQVALARYIEDAVSLGRRQGALTGVLA